MIALTSRRGISALLLVALLCGPVLAVAAQTSDAGEIERVTEDVLNRPAYTGERSGFGSALTDNPVTRWLADRWADFIEWLSGLGGERDPRAPTTERDQGRSAFGLLIGVLAAVAVALIAFRLARTRETTEQQAAQQRNVESTDVPDDIDDAVSALESAGEYEAAIRLRFAAGLRELDRVGVVSYKPTTPTYTLRREIDLDEFDAVATNFEIATYSEYEATEADARAAEAGWRDILSRLRGRRTR